MKYLIILALLLSGCASVEQRKQEALNTEYDEHQTALLKDFKDGKLGEVEFSNKQLTLNEHYFPNAHITHATLRDRVALASALERREITRLQFDLAWNERRRQYDIERVAEEARYQRELARYEAQQNPPISPVQAILMMNMINNSANRIGNSLNPPAPLSTNCNSYADFSGVVRTTCY